MGGVLASVSFEYCVILDCPPQGGAHPCNIPLPRQSHLGTYAGQEYRPTHDWRETFLCLRHGQVFLCSPANIHLETDMRSPGQRVSPLWQIDVLCGLANCPKRHTIYTGRMLFWSDILKRILQMKPRILCDEHDLVWEKDLIEALEIAH